MKPLKLRISKIPTPDDISGTRERSVGEIVPAFATQSSTRGGNENEYGANKIMDLDLETTAETTADATGKIWIELSLGRLYCVEKALRYQVTGPVSVRYDCSGENKECKCTTVKEGDNKCSKSKLSVMMFDLDSHGHLSPNPNCVYGNKLRIESTIANAWMKVNEIAIFYYQGRTSALVYD